jgi:Carboxypeptidase regulatory-like domain
MNWIRISLLLAVIVTGIACSSAWAQATAQISGTVRDQSGAVLPGVEVTATQTDTGISRAAVTNETGSYILPNLAVGPYRLEAALPGFRTFIQTGIVLQVNSNPAINPVLEVGQVTEQVEVQANAALVETRSTAVGQVIENQRILELPLNGRQVTDLITLSGAAVQTGVSPDTSWQGGVYISIAGGQAFGVAYSLDGAMHTNVYDGSQMPMPFPDALQEFKVAASGIAANGGTRGSGGQVNAVTKSGTNEIHGDAFEFVRNYSFNARNYFAQKRDSLKRNQYGGTLGGPIIKNKIFFFGGYQGTKTRSDPGDSIGYVPTEAILAGDWTAFASPACNAGRQITLRAPFVNNRIDPSLYSTPAKKIAAKLPKAQDECGKFTYGAIQKPNEYQAIGKVDYQWSAKHAIFGRYMATTLSRPHPFELSGNLLTTTEDGFDNFAQSYAFGSTYLAGPSTVNAFRLTVNRTAINRAGAHFFSAPDIGVKSYSQLKDHIIVNVTGGFTLGRCGDSTFRTTAYQIGDDLSLVRGNHQITFGGNLAHWRTNQRAHTNDVGNYTFNGTATNLGMADFMIGALTTLAMQTPTQWGSRQWYLGASVQCD